MLESLTKSIMEAIGALSINIIKGVYDAWVGQPVKYRDTIKLKHVASQHTLHSHNIEYSHRGTSSQQQVTAYAGSDSNDYWIVKGPNGQPDTYKEGQAVRHGDMIRLEHLNTGRNLHSHTAPSPVTKQQEVTAYGDAGIGDRNDNWRIEVEKGGIWYEKSRVRFIHVDTQHSLHSHKGFSHPEHTAGQQEVTCYEGRDNNDWWRIAR